MQYSHAGIISNVYFIVYHCALCPANKASRETMLNFWQEPENSLWRAHEYGIYISYLYGEGKQGIQVILPGLRSDRDATAHVSLAECTSKRKLKK